MTRDDIIELALQCGIWIPLASGPEREQTIDKLRRFAALVQREECIAKSRAVARLLRFCVHFCVHPHHPAYGYSASPIGATG